MEELVAIDQPAKHDLFVSYAHEDDNDNRIDAIVMAIQRDFLEFSGRPLDVFFDKKTIASMDDWMSRILTALRESSVFIAILSPNYIKSIYCRKEWRAYVEAEISRQLLHLKSVATVYYASVDDPAGSAKLDRATQAWVNDLKSRQFGCDARPWREGGPEALQAADVRDKLRSLSKSIGHRIKEATAAKASATTVPPHNPNFVGRVAELRALRHHMQEAIIGTIASVQGIGGIGKSELAFTYAHGYAGAYPGGRFLLSCENASNFANVLMQLSESPETGIHLTSVQRANTNEAAGLVRKELLARGRTLLLLDNVNQPALLRSLDKVLPDRRNIDILATTRLESNVLPVTGFRIELESLLVDDAVSLFEKFRSFGDELEEEAAFRIAGMLGGHVLACEVAAIYLRTKKDDPNVSYAAYAEWLSEEMLPALQAAGATARLPDGTSRINNPQPLVDQLLRPTLELLTEHERYALLLGAHFAPDAVPKPYVEALLGQRYADLAVGVKRGQPDLRLEVIGRLVGLHLLIPTEDDRIFRMHRIVRAIVQNDAISSGELVRTRKIIADFIEYRVFQLQEPVFNPKDIWELRCLEQAIDILLSGQPSRQIAVIGSIIGSAMGQIGNLASAVRLLRSCVQVFDAEVLTNPSDSDRRNHSVTLKALGDLERTMGQTDAQEHYEQAEKIDEDRVRASPSEFQAWLDLAASSLNVGRAKLDNDTSEAKAHYLRSLGICSALEKDQPDAIEVRRHLSAVLSSVADLEKDQGYWKKARGHYRRAQKIDEKLLRQHPKDIPGLRGLAITLIKIGDWEQDYRPQSKLAQTYYDRALEIRKQQVAETPSDLEAQHGLRTALERLGDIERVDKNATGAQMYYKSSLQIAEQRAMALPEDVSAQRDLLVTYRKLGEVLAALNEKEEVLSPLADGFVRVFEHMRDSAMPIEAWMQNLYDQLTGPS